MWKNRKKRKKKRRFFIIPAYADSWSQPLAKLCLILEFSESFFSLGISACSPLDQLPETLPRGNRMIWWYTCLLGYIWYGIPSHEYLHFRRTPEVQPCQVSSSAILGSTLWKRYFEEFPMLRNTGPLLEKHFVFKTFTAIRLHNGFQLRSMCLSPNFLALLFCTTLFS